MPKVDPARWLAARHEWESSLDVSYTDIAAKLGTSIPTVALRARRELWVRRDEVVDLTVINYSPRQLTEIAMRTLVRAALQTKDTASAVKAAGMILDRTMGRVVAEQTKPMLPADIENEENQWPEWLRSQRLGYRAGDYAPDDGFEPSEAPDPAPPLTQPPIDVPSIAAEAPAPLPEPFRPRLVPAEPRFWAGPGRPAS